MCYSGKCMHCFEVETGALIFAILNVMITSLGSVISFGGLVYTSVMAKEVINTGDRLGDQRMVTGGLIVGLATNAAFGILTVAFAISFSFAVVLIVGLCKRKANLVKCYFVYGVVKTVIGVAIMCGFFFNGFAEAIISLILVYVIYSLILVMVHNTYKKFEAEVPFNAYTNPMSNIEKF